MKKALGILAAAMVIHFGVAAQEETDKKASEIVKPSRDFVMLQAFYDGWNVTSGENVKHEGIGRGFAGYILYDFPLGNNKTNTHFSFAAGLGVSSHNVYFKDQLPNLESTDSLYFMDTNEEWKGHKFSTTYLEMPLELRFFGNSLNRNKGFKFSVGAKVGLLLDAHTKYAAPTSGTYLTYKKHANKFNETWRLTPMVRVGWGNFALFAQYSITNMFKLNEGPKVFPYSIGLTVTGL